MGFANAWAQEAARHEHRYKAIRGRAPQCTPPDRNASDSVNSVNSVHRQPSAKRPAPGDMRKHTVGNGTCARAISSSFYGQELGPGCARPRKKVTPNLLNTYKTSRAWLNERIEALLKAGWTPTALFRVGRHAYPYGWGAAWSSLWMNPEASQELTSMGEIVWTITGTNKKNYQVMRPEAYRQGR